MTPTPRSNIYRLSSFAPWLAAAAFVSAMVPLSIAYEGEKDNIRWGQEQVMLDQKTKDAMGFGAEKEDIGVNVVSGRDGEYKGYKVTLGHHVWRFIAHRGSYNEKSGISEYHFNNSSAKVQREVLFRSKPKADQAWKEYVKFHQDAEENLKVAVKWRDPNNRKQMLERLLGHVDAEVTKYAGIFGKDYLGSLTRIQSDIRREKEATAAEAAKGKVSEIGEKGSLSGATAVGEATRKGGDVGGALDRTFDKADRGKGKSKGEAAGGQIKAAAGPGASAGTGGPAAGGAMRATESKYEGTADGKVPAATEARPEEKKDTRWWITRKVDEAKAQTLVDDNRGDLSKLGHDGKDAKLKVRQEGFIKTHPEDVNTALDQWTKEHPETSPETLKKSRSVVDDLAKQHEQDLMKQGKKDDRWWFTRKLDEAKAEMIVNSNHGDLTDPGSGDPKVRARQEQFIKDHPEDIKKALEEWKAEHPESR